MATARSLALSLQTGSLRTQRQDTRQVGVPAAMSAALYPRGCGGRVELESTFMMFVPAVMAPR